MDLFPCYGTMQESEVRDLPNLSSQLVGQWHKPSPSPTAHLFPRGLYGSATLTVFPGEFVGMGWFCGQL